VRQTVRQMLVIDSFGAKRSRPLITRAVLGQITSAVFFEWRTVKYEYYDKAVSLRDLCDLMTHDSRTHLKHYGAWTSDKDKKDSVIRAVGKIAGAI